MLKALIKYRDYLARIEDESPTYVMPNHIMFSLAKVMPTTKNEYRDCCRAGMTALLLKYQDDIIDLIKTKLQAAKSKNKNSHVVFESSVAIASNPMAEQEVSAKLIQEMDFKDKVEFQLGVLPTFKVKIMPCNRVSAFTSESEPKVAALN